LRLDYGKLKGRVQAALFHPPVIKMEPVPDFIEFEFVAYALSFQCVIEMKDRKLRQNKNSFKWSKQNRSHRYLRDLLEKNS